MKDLVLFWGSTEGRGLTYHFAHMAAALAANMNNQGIDFYVVSENAQMEEGLWDFLGNTVPVERQVRYALNCRSEMLPMLCRLINSSRRSVLHIHGYRQLLSMMPLVQAYEKKLRVVYTIHSFSNTQRIKKLFHSAYLCTLFFRYVDYVIFLSPSAASEFFGSQLLFRNGRAGIIPLGAEEYSYIMPSARDAGGQNVLELLENPGVRIGVYLANFYKEKGQRWLVKELVSVMREHPNFFVLLLGDGKDHGRVVSDIEILGLSDKIICPGRISRRFIPWVLRHCDFAFAPSYSETFGHSCVEPMLAGLPVIGTRAGAAGYLIQDYATGIRVAYNQPGQITLATKYLLRNPGIAKEMGLRAQSFASSIFYHRDSASAHSALYQRLLHN